KGVSSATVAGTLVKILQTDISLNRTPANLANMGVDTTEVQFVRDGVLEIKGTANDTDSQDAFYYDLQVHSLDATLVATARGTTRMTTAGLLGRLDVRNV